MSSVFETESAPASVQVKDREKDKQERKKQNTLFDRCLLNQNGQKECKSPAQFSSFSNFSFFLCLIGFVCFAFCIATAG